MKPVILIDNGHGVDTPGKRSPDAAKGLTDSQYYLREYAWARETAKFLVSLLKSSGYDASLVVPEDKDIPLSERCSRVNKMCSKYGKKNVILVSIHNNAAGNGSKWMTARGWQAHTTKGITDADKLSDCLYDAAEKMFRYPLKVRKYSFGKNNRDFEDNFYILMHSYCPAVLVENFFQDNKDDVLYLNSSKGKWECTKVLFDGIVDYIRKYCM